MHTRFSVKTSVISLAGLASAVALSASAQTPAIMVAPPGGVVAAKMPDAEGVHLGMTVDQATAVMKRVFPGNGLLVRYSSYRNGPTWVSSLSGTSADQHDFLVVSLSMPPNPQQVVAIQRTMQLLPGKQPTADSTMASLRQKYGPGLPVAPRLTGMMAWAYDEQGQPANPQGPANWSSTDCAREQIGVSGGQAQQSSPLEIPYSPDSLSIPQKIANYSGNLCEQDVYVSAQLLTGTIQGTSVVNGIFLYLAEKPLMIRDYIASQEYLAGVANAATQQQMKNAQHEKAPTL